jgi:hypothetical protein
MTGMLDKKLPMTIVRKISQDPDYEFKRAP